MSPKVLILLLVLVPSLAYGDRNGVPVNAPTILNAKRQSSKNEMSFVTFDCKEPRVFANGEIRVNCIRVRNYVERKDGGVCRLGITMVEEMQFTLKGRNWVLSQERADRCTTPVMFVLYPDGGLWGYREIVPDKKCKQTVYEWNWSSKEPRIMQCTSFQ